MVDMPPNQTKPNQNQMYDLYLKQKNREADLKKNKFEMWRKE